MLYSSNIDVARDETGKDARFDHVPASRACRFLPNFYGKEYNAIFHGDRSFLVFLCQSNLDRLDI